MFSSADSWTLQSSNQDPAQNMPHTRRESDGSISLQSATSTTPSVDNTPATNFVPAFSSIEEPLEEEVSIDEIDESFPQDESYNMQNEGNSNVSNEVRSKVYTDAYTHGYTEGWIARSAEPPVAKQMPIAIVGMACRLPGEKKDVTTPDEFWELCSRARSGWSEIPESRFKAGSYQHPNPGKNGCFNPVGGCFLKEDVGLFDAPFFSLTAQEATSMDPQQRMLLEVTFEALESAGIPKHSIIGKDVGVFVGGSFSEYDVQALSDADTIPPYQATGCALAMQSNRLSHFFDLRGPSFTMDTACSSSMVALHQACQSIRNGESQSAIVASAHLNMIPEIWISYSMSRLFSDEGRSFSFDSRGTGYGRGEGCGVMILKPLDQALKDGDAIRSVIVASGVNQDGKTPGITMPNGLAQEDLMNSVYRSAGIDPSDCGYVEAHGTGTKVGDPIEARALYNVFGQGRSARNPLFVGSVKSNIGHLEAASGIVAVIKTSLMLERGFVLPNFDYRRPNPSIPLTKWNLKVPISQRPWPRPKRFASVNNFGFGGTNGHVVLERAPFVKRFEGLEGGDTAIKSRMLYILSANDKLALETLMKNIGIYLEQRPEIFQNDLLSNLAYTLGQRRSLMQWRVGITTDSSFDLVQGLNGGKLVLTKVIEPLRIGFVFTGQGAQWNAMGRELYSSYPVYAAAIDACDNYLHTLSAPFSLVEELARDAGTSRIHEAYLSQPICTAIQIALVDLFKSWGITPTAVTGHSSGEIGAAYAAGILPAKTCMAIAYYRGLVTLALKRQHPDLRGAMMAVGCSKEDIIPLISGLVNREVRIACFNSPESLTISGDELAIDELQVVLESKGLFARKLQVEMAYHSHHMELVAKEYRDTLQDIEFPITTDVLFHSSLLGHAVDGDTLEISYWVQNLTRAVRFSEAVSSMCEPRDEHKTGVNMIVEIGPHAALAGPIKQIMKSIGPNAMKIPYASALVRNKDAVESSISLANVLFMKGSTSLNVGALNFPKTCKPPALLVDLPRYPWNHQTKYWHEPHTSLKSKHRELPRNDLLGTLAAYSDDAQPTWRNVLHLDNVPWLRHHKIQGVVLFPMSGFMALVLEAIKQAALMRDIHYDTFRLKDVLVRNALILSEEGTEITLQLRPQTQNIDDPSCKWEDFQIKSWSHNKGWTEHCTGRVAVTVENDRSIDNQVVERTAEKQLLSLATAAFGSASEFVDTAALFTNLTELGVAYGPSFTGLQECKANTECSSGLVKVVDVSQEMPFGCQTTMVIQPSLLESVIMMYWPMIGAINKPTTIFLPSSIESVKISRNITRFTEADGSDLQTFCHGQISCIHPRPSKMSISATAQDDPKTPMIELTNLIIAPIIERNAIAEHVEYRSICYKTNWEPIQLPALTIMDIDSPSKELFASANEFPANQPSELVSEKIASDTGAAVTGSGELNMDVTVICGSSQSQTDLAAAITNALEQITGVKPLCGALGCVETKGRVVLVLNEIEEPLFSNLTSRQFSDIQTMLAGVQGVLWIVRGAYLKSTNPDVNMVVGFSRSVRSEALLKFATLDLDSTSILSIKDTAHAILQISLVAFASTAAKDCELEFAERNGVFLTPRFMDDSELNEIVDQQDKAVVLENTSFIQPDRPLKMELKVPNDLKTLRFIDVTPQDVVLPTEVEVEVKAIGVNEKDIMTTTEDANSTNRGTEFSGIITRVGSEVHNFAVGDRVAGLSMKHGVYSRRTTTDEALIHKMIHKMSFEEAASMTSAYCATYYGLMVLGRMVKGEKLLIHGAASATGQAAIHLAQMTGVMVFATVDSTENKEKLMVTCGLQADHIFSGQKASFSLAIQNSIENDHEGIDIVLNCTRSSFSVLRETRRCLSRFGRLVDLVDQGANEASGGARLGFNRTSISVDLYALAEVRPKIMKRLIADVSELLEHGRIKPLAITVFPMSDVAGAFQMLRSDNLFGKIIVAPQPGDMVKAMPYERQKLFRADATYLLIGGTGGLGRSIARWMADNGAKYVVLISRSASLTGKVKDLVEELANDGVEILLQQCDITDSVSVNKLVIEDLAFMPAVRGVVHGTMVLKDVLLEKMTYDEYMAVIRSKVRGAWNIHNALKSTKLDFFIAISSAATAVGNRGQSAYSAANSFLDAFIQYRNQLGLPGTSIALTAVSDAGYLAENAEAAAEVAKNLGSDTICLAEILALMRAAIDGRLAQTCRQHVITGLRITSPPPFWTNDAKFKYLRIAAEELSAKNGEENVTISYNEQIKVAKSIEEAQEAVTRGLLNKLAEVLMLEEEDMDVTRNLSAYALDSLVAIEVRNFITREFEANLQVLELLSSGSIETLAKLICTKTKLVTFEEES